MACLHHPRFTGLLAYSIILSYFTLSTVLGIQRFNVYKEYYVEDKCTSNNDIFYAIGRTGKNSAFGIGASRFPLSTQEKKCNVYILPPANSGIILNVDFLAFGASTLFYDCTHYVQIFGETGNYSKICGFMQFTYGLTTFVSLRGMRFRYFTNGLDNDHDPPYFTLIATAYKNGFPECPENMFRCDSGHCIWEGFVCDNVINCPDASDELISPSTNCTSAINLNNTSPIEVIDVPSSGLTPSPSSYTAAHVGATVGFIFLGIVCVLIRCFCFYSCASVIRSLINCVRARKTNDQPYRAAFTGTSSENPPPYSSRSTSTLVSEENVKNNEVRNALI